MSIESFETEAGTKKSTARIAVIQAKQKLSRDYENEKKKILANAIMLDKVEMKVFEDVKNIKNSAFKDKENAAM